MSDRDPIGYLACNQCLEVKKVYQGQGKRAKFLYSRCGCGVDQRTGSAVQAQFASHKSLEEATADLKQMSSPPEPKTTEKPPKKACKTPWIIGGVVAFFGLLSLRS